MGDPIQRENLDVDVLFVGGGPACLAGALHLARLAKKAGRELNITVIEKGKEFGAHGFSGAVMDPKGIAELIPDWRQQGAPVESAVEDDAIWFMTGSEALILPIVPPALDNHGNYIISLANFTRWMAGLCEKEGVNLFPGFPGWALLTENGRVTGVQTGDKGLDKHGERKANFEPGVNVKAKVTVFGEGPRGTVTRQLVERFALDAGKTPQVYATGVKEIWEMPAGTVPKGRVIHTMGWPNKSDQFGGGFIYAMSNDRWAVGFVVGLDYKDPFTDPHYQLQLFKTHPKVRALLEGGKMTEYGAKTIPEGGWDAVPKLVAPGALIIGDSASLLDAMRLKGVHLAIKSGQLAAETIWEAVQKDDFSERGLAPFQTKVESSWIQKELSRSKDFKKGFKLGFHPGMVGAAFIQFFGFSPFRDFVKIGAGHKQMQTLQKYHGSTNAKPERIKFDGKLTFSKVDDVYASGTMHDEDSPCHLLVMEPDLCTKRCVEEYGNPCQHFCPAAVYEWIRKDESDRGSLRINFSNCVHCKTCDIMDPYGIIRWVPPEGASGPAFKNL